MRINHLTLRIALLFLLMLNLTTLSTRLRADTGTCGGQMITLPFTDVASSPFFCQIASAFFSGLTNGTTATTYTPSQAVPREQMAAFVSRTLDQSVRRSHPRAALGEWWTNEGGRYFTSTGFHNPQFMACDGQTVWVSNTQGNTVSRIDIKTGELICTLTGVPSPEKIVIVSGRVYVASFQSPGSLYGTNINQTTNGAMAQLTSGLGANPIGITYDGQYLWMANFGGSISRYNFIDITTYTTGFSQPAGILFDGANLWVTDAGDASLKRVDRTTGAVLQTIALSGSVGHPVFDGTNLWIPCGGIAQQGVPDKVFVVRGVGGLLDTVLAQLTGNGLNGAFQAAFDGERICVTNAAGETVSLWKASDLSPIGFVNIARGLGPNYNPRGVCSDGTSFFIGMRSQSGASGLIIRL